MAHEQLDRLESFRVFITAAEEGAAIPPVAEHDLKCLHELCVERAKHYCGKDGVVSIDSMRLQSRRESACCVAAPRST